MANRISDSNLREVAGMLDRRLGNTGDEPQTVRVSLEGAYGGWKFCDIRTGTDLLGTGYVSRRELYEAAHYFMRGFRAAQQMEAAIHG